MWSTWMEKSNVATMSHVSSWVVDRHEGNLSDSSVERWNHLECGVLLIELTIVKWVLPKLKASMSDVVSSEVLRLKSVAMVKLHSYSM